MGKRKNSVKKILLIILCIGTLNICFNSNKYVYAATENDEKQGSVTVNDGSKDSSSIDGFEWDTKTNNLYYHYTDANGKRKTINYGKAIYNGNGVGSVVSYVWKIDKNSDAWKQATEDGLADISDRVHYDINNDDGTSGFYLGGNFFPSGTSGATVTENGKVTNTIENGVSTGGGGYVPSVSDTTISIDDTGKDKSTGGGLKIGDVDPNKYDPTGKGGSTTKFRDKARLVLGAVRNVSIVVSVIVLMVIGLKYILGSVEERANYKETLLPYVIGAIMAVAGTSLVSFIYNSIH